MFLMTGLSMSNGDFHIILFLISLMYSFQSLWLSSLLVNFSGSLFIASSSSCRLMNLASCISSFCGVRSSSFSLVLLK